MNQIPARNPARNLARNMIEQIPARIPAHYNIPAVNYCLFYACTGFIQKHENEIPGLFQDNSRTFFLVFKDSISLTFRQFLIVFSGNGYSEIGHISFLSPEYFHQYRDYR